MRHAVYSVILLAPLFAQDRTRDDLLKLPLPNATRIAYGTGTLQFGELRVPAARGPHPVVIIVHGGCWVSQLGNLDDRAVALDLVRPIRIVSTSVRVRTNSDRRSKPCGRRRRPAGG